MTWNEKNTIYINEPGLYLLILKSQKAEAEEFQDWITSDVLPSIRRNGSYSVQPSQQPQTIPFYDNNMLYTYNNKNVIYIGYIGRHNNEHESGRWSGRFVFIR